MIIIMKMVSTHMFPLFPLSGVRCCPQLCHRPHLIVFSTLLCLLSSSSSLPPLLSSSHLSSHSPPISALTSLLPCSRNYAALLGSLSSAILSTCPAHCNLLLTVSLSNSSALPSLPLTPPFFACLVNKPLLLLFFVPSCFRTLAAFVVVVQSVPRFPFRTGMPVWHKCS